MFEDPTLRSPPPPLQGMLYTQTQEINLAIEAELQQATVMGRSDSGLKVPCGTDLLKGF